DAHDALAERNEPDPQAGIGEVRRREMTARIAHASVERGGADVVEVRKILEASPDRGDAMTLFHPQVLRLREETGAAGCIHDPARRDLLVVEIEAVGCAE